MRISFSWRDGGALLTQAFVMMLIATLVSAEYPTIKPEAKDDGGGISCNKCDVNEDNYRGPTWAYPCMKGYQGPKKEDVKCHNVPPNADGCFRRLSVIGGKKVVGSGGCFDSSKKACVEEVTKVKFNEATGCIPETVIDPIMNKNLTEKCHIFTVKNEKDDTSPAPSERRKREAEDDLPRAVICVCTGDGCNNAANGMGRSVDSAAPSITPISALWIGVVSAIGLIGASFLVNKQA